MLLCSLSFAMLYLPIVIFQPRVLSLYSKRCAMSFAGQACIEVFPHLFLFMVCLHVDDEESRKAFKLHFDELLERHKKAVSSVVSVKKLKLLRQNHPCIISDREEQLLEGHLFVVRVYLAASLETATGSRAMILLWGLKKYNDFWCLWNVSVKLESLFRIDKPFARRKGICLKVCCAGHFETVCAILQCNFGKACVAIPCWLEWRCTLHWTKPVLYVVLKGKWT